MLSDSFGPFFSTLDFLHRIRPKCLWETFIAMAVCMLHITTRHLFLVGASANSDL